MRHYERLGSNPNLTANRWAEAEQQAGQPPQPVAPAPPPVAAPVAPPPPTPERDTWIRITRDGDTHSSSGFNAADIVYYSAIPTDEGDGPGVVTVMFRNNPTRFKLHLDPPTLLAFLSELDVKTRPPS